MLKIHNLKIGEKPNNTMYIGLSLINPERSEDVTQKIFEEEFLSHAQGQPSIDQDNQRWFNVHYSFNVGLVSDGRTSQIVFCEKNNPEGPYGRGVALQCLPAVLMQWDIIDQEEFNLFSSFIAESEVVKQRLQTIREKQSPYRAEMDRITRGFGRG